MSKNKNINTRGEARTSDVQGVTASATTTYHFPTLGVSVEATSYQEALEKAKESYKEKLPTNE